MIKLLLTFSVLITVVGFFPPLRDAINKKFSFLPDGLLQWLGLAGVGVWTYVMFPPPFRGYLLGASLVGVGALFSIGARFEIFAFMRKFVSTTFYNGKDIFQNDVVKNYGWALMGAGAVIILPMTAKMFDSVALLALLISLVVMSFRENAKSRKKPTTIATTASAEVDVTSS